MLGFSLDDLLSILQSEIMHILMILFIAIYILICIIMTHSPSTKKRPNSYLD